MISEKLLKTLRKLKSSRYLELRGAFESTVVVNCYENKILEFYALSNQKMDNEPQMLSSVAVKKRIVGMIQTEDKLLVLDKHGDLYELNLSPMENHVDDKIVELEVPKLISGILAEGLEFKQLDKNGSIVLTDNYYRLFLLDKKNPQNIYNVRALRRFYIKKIFYLNEKCIGLFFEDGKVYLSKSPRIEDVYDSFDEKKLVDLYESNELGFFTSFEKIGKDNYVGLRYNDSSKTLQIEVFKFIQNEQLFKLIRNETVNSVDSDFSVISDRLYLLDRTLDLI